MSLSIEIYLAFTQKFCALKIFIKYLFSSYENSFVLMDCFSKGESLTQKLSFNFGKNTKTFHCANFRVVKWLQNDFLARKKNEWNIELFKLSQHSAGKLRLKLKRRSLLLISTFCFDLFCLETQEDYSKGVDVFCSNW